MLYDFIDGSLACGNAENAVHQVIDFINAHPDQRVIYIADSHPENHSSFMENGGIWPVHCVEGTRGDSIHEAFYTDIINPANRPNPETNIFRKGFKTEEEQYSGFESVGPDGKQLKEVVGKNLIISGIATEYCVKNTAEEFLNDGHNIEIFAPGLGYVDYKGHVKTVDDLKNVVTVIE
ncbi:MAG: isochorismatase family protein [Bacteroidales bacterium]|nr:isochorismatase family protein [Bacteroidales bacterium]